VTAARFEMYAVVRRTAARSRPDPPTAVTWRLLSGNNRDLGRAASAFPDTRSCLTAVRELRRMLPGAVVAVGSPDGRGRWTWRIRLDSVEVAVSSRGYQRRVQAEAACRVFLSLVADAQVTDTLRLVSF
jgi:hypothetical protein